MREPKSLVLPLHHPVGLRRSFDASAAEASLAISLANQQDGRDTGEVQPSS
jgi:hypothetical protein